MRAGIRKQELGTRMGDGRRIRRFPLPASCFLSVMFAVAVLFAPAPAHAEPNGVITGELTAATPGGPSVAGVDVRLFIFKGTQGEEQAQRVATADAGGRFRFEELETGDEYTYQVAANYAGLPYGTGGLKFNAGETEKTVKLEVWDVTTENPGVVAESASFLLIGADAETESAFALEITELVNPSNKAYRPMPGGAAGPMNLVRFSLPAGATDLTPHLGVTEEEMVQVDRGFASMAVMLPGSKEFMYAYRFPYKDGKVSFTKNLWYGAKTFTLLALENTGDVTVPSSFTQDETVEIRGQRYRQWRGGGFEPGAAVELQFSSLPQPSVFRVPFRDQPVAAFSSVGVAAALAVAAAVAYQQRRTARLQPAVADDPTLPEGEIGEYLAALAELDDRFVAGDVPEAEYQRQRDGLKDDLKDLLRERDVQLAAPRQGR